MDVSTALIGVSRDDESHGSLSNRLRVHTPWSILPGGLVAILCAPKVTSKPIFKIDIPNSKLLEARKPNLQGDTVCSSTTKTISLLSHNSQSQT